MPLKESGTVFVTAEGRTICCSRPGRPQGFQSFFAQQAARLLSIALGRSKAHGVKSQVGVSDRQKWAMSFAALSRSSSEIISTGLCM